MRDIFTRLDRSRRLIIDFQGELVSARGLNPDSGGEGEAAKLDVVEKWLARTGPDERIHVDAPDSRVRGGVRPNLVARFKGGDRRRKIVILSHLDVVGPGEASAWRSDPWTLRVDGDRIYGRGVEDNNSAIVSSLLAVLALREAGLPLPGAVDLAFVSDEESGSARGLEHVLAARPELFSPDDLVFVPDAGDPVGGTAIIAEKGVSTLRFTVTGEQRHASTPAGGGNALRAAARLIGLFDQALPARFSARDPFFDPPASTFEPTRMDANVESTNIIPGRNVFYCDSRVLPRYRLEEVEAEYRKAADAVAAGERVRVDMQAVHRLPRRPPPGGGAVGRARDGAPDHRHWRQDAEERDEWGSQLLQEIGAIASDFLYTEATCDFGFVNL